MSAMGQSLQGACRWAGPEVRFCPKTDPISSPSPVAHACRLRNRAEEDGHAGSSECDPGVEAGAVTGAKPPLRPKHVWSIGGPRYFAWGRFRDFLSRPCRAPPKGRYAGSGTRDR